MEKVKLDFLNSEVIVQQLDNFCKYGKLVLIEQYGVWLKSQKETCFISFGNIKTIRINPNPREGY